VALLRALSLLGDEIALVTLMVRVASHGGHFAGTMVAALTVANVLPPVVLAPYAGWIVDRLNAKRLLIPLALFQAVVAASLALWTGGAITLALVLLLGCGVAFTLPGYGALVPAIVGVDNVGRAQGTLQAYVGLAAIAGPALGGLLVGAAGQRWPLVIDAITFVGLGVGTMLLHGNRVPERRALTRERGELSAGARFLWHDGLLRPLTAVVALVVLALGVVDVAMIFLVLRVMHAHTWEYGLTWAAFGTGLVAGSVASSRLTHDAIRSARRVFVCVGVLGLAFATVGLMPSVWWVILPMFIGGAANGLLSAAASTLFMTRSDDAVRGRVSACVNALFNAMQLVSLSCGGLLIAVWSARVIVFSSGALSLLTVLVLAPFALRAGRRSEEARTSASL